MIHTIAKADCTGCKMCADICTQNAIEFKVDKKGFWYPTVLTEKCTRCGVCTKVCPSLNPGRVPEMKEPKVLSAWNKDDAVRISSTSGGVFFEVAKAIIARGGVVIGSKYGADWKSAEHSIAYTMEELEGLKGSKYFQSNTQGIYKRVREELNQNRVVLFCGTPCQCAALRSYLGKDYENLYYMDFICRSINSPKAFCAYITELEKEYGANVVRVQLKNKNTGWQSLASLVQFENEKESHRDKNRDWWVKGFIGGDLYTRESCHSCKYRTLPRKSADITIGDFWGIKDQTQEDMFKGISLVMLNSARGKNLFKSVQTAFVTQERTMEEALAGNAALLQQPLPTKKQDEFFRLLEEKGFSKAVELCLKKSIGSRLKNGVKRVLRLGLRMGYYTLKSNISIPKFIYYNYLCSNVIRSGTAKLIPYKNAVIELKKGSRLYLEGSRNLQVGINKLKGSKQETLVRMECNAVWKCKNGGDLFYNTTVEIKENALFECGYFSANTGSVIIADKMITFGEDVMIGRNVLIYDSDFHQMRDEENEPCNPPKPVAVEDHVWLTANITVLKGVTIGKDSLITAQTVVNKNIPEHSLVGGKSSGTIIKDWVSWSRERCPRE